MAASWRGLVVVALLLAGFALKGALVAPPALPTHIGAGDFDTARAIGRLQRVLGDQRPHPVDSNADEAVRSRLIDELQHIGLPTRIQDGMDCSATPKSRAVSCSHVHNMIATVPARAPGPQLLLNAHYDSTPTGPGAGDDGLGVAALLEVGSILKAAPPPRPVTLLFNEGEEFGLNGAHAFLNDPQSRSVNSLINIDARGVTGPVFMFQTSDPNGAAIALYARATRHPYANSISSDFLKLIPNDTDVTFLKERGWTLLNYAIVGNETRYHSPGDNIASLDRRSLANTGEEVLAATRTMAGTPDPQWAGSGESVFTDLAGRGFIRLPLVTAAVGLGFLLICAFVLAWRRGALGHPLLVAGGMTLGGVAAGAVVGIALEVLRSGDFWRAYPVVAYLPVYAGAMLAMAVIQSRWAAGADRARMRAAAWLVVLVFGSAFSILLPGACIFFLIAPALALIGIAVDRRAPAAARILLILALVVQFLMFAEFLASIEMLLIDGPLWAVAPMAVLAALPALAEPADTRWRPALVLLGVVFVGTAAASFAMPRSSSERPLGFSIDYYRDATGGKADWAIATKQAPLPANFPGAWHKGELPYNGRPRWIATAPLLATPMPQARVIANEPAGSGRRIRLALSTGGADTIAIRFPANAKVRALGLPGAAVRIPTEGDTQKALLRCTGRSCDGLRIEVLFDDTNPVAAELFATRFGLPPQGQKLEAARPHNSQPQYSPDETITRAITKL